MYGIYIDKNGIYDKYKYSTRKYFVWSYLTHIWEDRETRKLADEQI